MGTRRGYGREYEVMGGNIRARRGYGREYKEKKGIYIMPGDFKLGVMRERERAGGLSRYC